MSLSLPNLYFRTKENGATVFRVVNDTRRNRLDLVPIANANTRNGTIRTQSNATLTKDERKEIKTWIKARQLEMSQRFMQDVRRTVDFLKTTTHWAQARATEEELNEVTDDLLLAMHDLRSTLVRKRADLLMEKQQRQEES